MRMFKPDGAEARPIEDFEFEERERVNRHVRRLRPAEAWALSEVLARWCCHPQAMLAAQSVMRWPEWSLVATFVAESPRTLRQLHAARVSGRMEGVRAAVAGQAPGARAGAAQSAEALAAQGLVDTAAPSGVAGALASVDMTSWGRASRGWAAEAEPAPNSQTQRAPGRGGGSVAVTSKRRKHASLPHRAQTRGRQASLESADAAGEPHVGTPPRRTGSAAALKSSLSQRRTRRLAADEPPLETVVTSTVKRLAQAAHAVELDAADSGDARPTAQGLHARLACARELARTGGDVGAARAAGSQAAQRPGRSQRTAGACTDADTQAADIDVLDQMWRCPLQEGQEWISFVGVDALSQPTPTGHTAVDVELTASALCGICGTGHCPRHFHPQAAGSSTPVTTPWSLPNRPAAAPRGEVYDALAGGDRAVVVPQVPCGRECYRHSSGASAVPTATAVSGASKAMQCVLESMWYLLLS